MISLICILFATREKWRKMYELKILDLFDVHFVFVFVLELVGKYEKNEGYRRVVEEM